MFYWLSFRIENLPVSGRTYQQRYDALEAAVAADSVDMWKETTSFIVFESNEEDIDVLALSFKAAIAPSHDYFLFRRMDSSTARFCGSKGFPAVSKFVKNVKRV